MNTNNTEINARQLAFFIAFFLPLGKLLELPSRLTAHAKGDLLIATFCGLLLEFLSFVAIFLFCKSTGSDPWTKIEERFGKNTSKILYGIYALFLLTFAILPLFDLEKFSHAAFSDTSPTFFIFTPFFILSGFICTKGIKGIGRAADLSPVLVLVPVIGLLFMSVGQADFSRLLPVVEKPIFLSLKAVWNSSAYFASGGLLLPIVCGYRYEKGDGKKLFPAFAVGAVLTLLFLAVFFAVFGLLGEKEHFAIMKIAQFFPALRFIGRIDLLLVYVLSIALFYYTAIPLQLFTEFSARCLSLQSKIGISSVLSVALYFAVLYGNKYTTAIHLFFEKWLAPIFLFFSALLPLLILLLLIKNHRGRYALNENSSSSTTEKSTSLQSQKEKNDS